MLKTNSMRYICDLKKDENIIYKNPRAKVLNSLLWTVGSIFKIENTKK
jgi:hypothetical protein